jgi:hypothetical protein
MTIDIVIIVLVGLLDRASTPPFISKGDEVTKGNRVSYHMISIRTLSLLVYFTYNFIDIIINALESTP